MVQNYALWSYLYRLNLYNLGALLASLASWRFRLFIRIVHILAKRAIHCKMWRNVEKVAKCGEKWGRMWITVEKVGI
jgi:ribosome biogenesis protein Nip4